MELTRLANETDDYRRRREELRLAEIDLMRQRERVAALRRQLPLETVVSDYELLTVGAGRPVRLSELFTRPRRTLILYHFMFGKAQREPCPMCTMWIDGFAAVAPHVTQVVDFAVAAAADVGELRSVAEERSWKNLTLLSCGASSFKYDLGSEDAEGNQDSAISVFVLGDDGKVRHAYTGKPRLAEDIHERGIDLLTPVWNLFDLTPDGRPDWYPGFSYDPGEHPLVTPASR